jgi:hypothetical protein
MQLKRLVAGQSGVNTMGHEKDGELHIAEVFEDMVFADEVEGRSCFIEE